MTNDAHQPLCFQRLSRATLQNIILKGRRGSHPNPSHEIPRHASYSFCSQHCPGKHEKYQLPQWLMQTEEEQERDWTFFLLCPLCSISSGENTRAKSHAHMCTYTHACPFAATVQKWLREAQLFFLRKFNLQSIWPHKAHFKGVQEATIPVIIITNPEIFAATDPFGDWGELAGGWPTWLNSFCVETSLFSELHG
jgi:hypothetical protein